MTLKNAEQVTRLRAKAAKVGKYASLAFKVLLVGYLVLSVLFISYSGATMLASGLSAPDLAWTAAKMLALVLSVAVGALTLTVFAQVFSKIAKGDSPFTRAQAKSLLLISLLLFADPVVSLIVSLAPLPDAQIGLLTLGMEAPKISLGPIMEGMVFLCFSYIFKYGASLQKLADDTV